MTKTRIAAVLATAGLAFAALPAHADEVRTVTPIEARSVSVAGVDMVAYFVPGADDLYDVTATWTDGTSLRRLVLRLDDGDSVTFALPGHADTLYTFARESARLIISTATSDGAFRNASL